MKALMMSRNANNQNRLSHDLTSLAGVLGDPELSRLAVDLEACISHHGQSKSYNRTRYPDSVSNGQIPAQLYTDEDAATAVELTGEIIRVVECAM
jgi:HEPN domain-containing protein